MTPEQALAKLEGKSEIKTLPREPLKDTLEEKRIPSRPTFTKEPPFKGKEITKTKDESPFNLDKIPDFVKVFGFVLIIGLLIILHLWRLDAATRNAYKNGFSDGVASISPNLASAQTDISDKLQQMNQMQQEITTTSHNLELMTQQKDQLAQSLKETQESLPGKIGAVEQRLEDRIKKLTNQYQKTISDLNNQLGFAQKNMSDKDQLVAAVQKDINDKVQQMDKMQQDLSRSEQNSALLQEKLTKAKQDLKLLAQKTQPAQQPAAQTTGTK